jgi:hypothetical protein
VKSGNHENELCGSVWVPPKCNFLWVVMATSCLFYHSKCSIIIFNDQEKPIIRLVEEIKDVAGL